MKKHRVTSLVLLIATIHVWLPLRYAAAATQQFMVFYSNDVLGETEPCG